MTSPPATRVITIGVDSHKDTHVAVAVDQLGRILATTSIPTTPHACVPQLWWSPGTRIGGLTCGNAWWIAARACY
jgi:transposase